MARGVGWAAQRAEIDDLARRVEAIEQGRPSAAPLLAAMAQALQPLADLVHPDAGELPDDAVVTRGNPLAGKAVTAGQCKRAAQLIAQLRRLQQHG